MKSFSWLISMAVIGALVVSFLPGKVLATIQCNGSPSGTSPQCGYRFGLCFNSSSSWSDSCGWYYGYCGYCKPVGSSCNGNSCQSNAGGGGGCSGNSVFSQSGCSTCNDAYSCGSNLCGQTVTDGCGGTHICDDSSDNCTNENNYCANSGYTNVCGTFCGGTIGGNCGGEAVNHCAGSTYTSPNGCGSCTGTKGPSCANPATVCAGTGITSSNGCGTCPGGTLGPVCQDPAQICAGTGISSSNGCGTCPGGTLGPVCQDPAQVCAGTGISSSNGCGSCTGGTRCDTPAISSLTANPVDDADFNNVTYVDINWSVMTTDWNGAGSCGGGSSYTVCVGTNSVDPCSGGTSYTTPNPTTYTYRYSQSAVGRYYWRVRATNDCGLSSGGSFIHYFDIFQPAKTCSITLSTNEMGVSQTTDITLTANANSTYGDTARVWLEKWNTGAQVSPNNLSPAATEGLNVQYYYHFTSADCNSSMSSCTKTTTISVPTAGNYYLHCDVPTMPKGCSGNPFCPYEGLGGTAACGSYVSCSATDNKALCVDGFTAPADANVGNAYVTGWNAAPWGACSTATPSTRSRTRSCTGDCAGKLACKTYLDSKAGCAVANNCSAAVLNGGTGRYEQTETEQCKGTISGYIFDASDCNDCGSCPTTTNLTSGDFTVSGPMISTNPISINGSGQYSLTGYAYSAAPTASYSFNFSNLVAAGLAGDPVPRLVCASATPVLSDPLTTCRDESCNSVTNSFGMWR